MIQNTDNLLIGSRIMNTTLPGLICEPDQSRAALLVEKDREAGRESAEFSRTQGD
jgi:hypothetical protein